MCMHALLVVGKFVRPHLVVSRQSNFVFGQYLSASAGTAVFPRLSVCQSRPRPLFAPASVLRARLQRQFHGLASLGVVSYLHSPFFRSPAVVVTGGRGEGV